MSLLQYVETRKWLSVTDHAWAELAAAIIDDYISSGCYPCMDNDWFRDLCFMINVNPDDLQAKIEFIFGED